MSTLQLTSKSYVQVDTSGASLKVLEMGECGSLSVRVCAHMSIFCGVMGAPTAFSLTFVCV